MAFPKAAEPFQSNAQEYDSWYDSSPLFDIEIEALLASETRLIPPALEIGVGPGRFAQALGTEFGIDPALSPLQLALHRSIIPINGIGEQLPFKPQTIGTVYVLFTLCFLMDPATAFREINRILKPDGFLVVGFIPAESEWGKHLAQKGKNGHPYYRHAHFKTVAETSSILANQGFHIVETWSTLFQSPSSNPSHEHPRPEANEEAGFCVLTTSNKGE